MRLTKDVELVNRIINHPSVLPYVSLPNQTYIDSSVFFNDENFVFASDGGCFIFHKHDVGVYEVHSQFLPEYRGRSAFRDAKYCAREMFLGTDCMEILTKVPESNLPAKGLTQLMRFSHLFTRHCWETKTGIEDLFFYSLKYDEWLKHSDMENAGEIFHLQLEEEKKKLGVEDQHADDPAHNKAVGASIEMLKRGQHFKSEWLYNKWAKFSGYETVELLSLDPIIVDIREAVIKITDKVEVLTCQ